MRKGIKILLLAIALASVVFSEGVSVRLKDIAKVSGVRSNQIMGVGLVVGLKGTGDSSMTFTDKALTNLLNNMGATAETTRYKSKNVATVMVTAELPPFMKPGQKLDVFVSSIGDSTSLKDGTLIMTPLKGPDGKTYVVAQGPVVFGGKESTSLGSNKRPETVCKVLEGGIVENTVPMEFIEKNKIFLVLNKSDFTTAMRVAEALEKGGYPGCKAIDPLTIEIPLTVESKDDVVKFVAGLEDFQVVPDTVAKVVINQRTGTVVIGENVRLSPVAVSHGDFQIKIEGVTEDASADTGDAEKQQLLAQLNQMGGGTEATAANGEEAMTAGEESAAAEETPVQADAATAKAVTPLPVTTPQSSAKQKNDKNVVIKLVKLKAGTSLSTLVKALNSVGATPYDLVAIIQALKTSGSLSADVEII